MNKADNIPSFASFNTGIIGFSTAGKEANRIPVTMPISPSDATVQVKLNKLFKENSLGRMLHDSLVPVVKDKNNLTPSIFRSRLQDAKKTFRKKAKKAGNNAKVYDQVADDLEEMEGYDDLLWLLRQVVHIA